MRSFERSGGVAVINEVPASWAGTIHCTPRSSSAAAEASTYRQRRSARGNVDTVPGVATTFSTGFTVVARLRKNTAQTTTQ